MNALKGIISWILTGFIFLVNGIDMALICLAIVMACDYFTGILSALYNKKLSSKVGFLGILKKASYLAVIMLAVVIDRLTGQAGLIKSLVIYFFVANDGFSIIENLAEMNIKLPKRLVASLEQISKKVE